MRIRAINIFGRKTYATRRVIGDFPVHLRSDLRKVCEDFADFYPQPDSDRFENRAIEIEICRSGRSRLGRSLYRVTADGHEMGAKYPARRVFPLVEWGINLRVIETARRFIQFHAASMVHGGNGFVFAGDSGCGKSTLAATLLGRQSSAGPWQYLSDEFALVDTESLRLHAFPKALCIKSGSLRVMEDLGLPLARHRHYVKAYKGPVRYLAPRDLGPARIGRPAPVRYVIFPVYGQGEAACLSPMTRAEAATELYRCCFNKGALGSRALPLIIRIVQEARCFRLTVGSPAQTASLLESLNEEAPAPELRREVWVPPRAMNSSRRTRQAPAMTSRRDILKAGVKVAFVAPAVMTLTSRQAFAAASNPSGVCSTATQTGGLCETDLDCCSRECNLGVCR